MPRNGSGVYNLPTGINPVSPNTPIASSWANTTLGDIASALSQSLARDGQTTPIANLPMGGFRHTNVSNPSARNQYASLGWVQDGFHIRATSVGGTNDITAQLLGGATVLQTGQIIQLTPVNTNTGAVTLNVNTIGAKQVVRINGLQFASGQFVTGTPYVLIYDGTKFICLNASIDSGSAPATIGPSTGNTVSSGTHTHNLDLTANYTWTGNHTFNGNLSGSLSGSVSGNSTTATRLATARNFTIGGTSRSFNGSANVSWSLSDIGAAAVSHTHDASAVISGKFAVARIPHINGNESSGYARFSCNSDNENSMGSLRILTGGTSLRYYYEGSTVWQLNSSGSMVLYGPLSSSSGNLTFNSSLDMPDNSRISFGGNGGLRANSAGTIVSAESGTIYLRPMGDGGNSNQTTINTAGNMSVGGNISSTGTVSDSISDLRRTCHRTATGNGNFLANALNCINEKANNTAYTWNIPTGLGSAGDIITILNTGSSGNVTVVANSGVTMYRSGASVSSVIVSPGNCINFLRTGVSNRWQVMG